MDTHPTEPHIPTPLEDTPCTRCRGSGEVSVKPVNDDMAVLMGLCPECGGSGSGYECVT